MHDDDYDDIISFNDEYFMRAALRQAETADMHNEIPVGAVAVVGNSIIARAWNQVEMLKDPTEHAEILLITQAASAVGDWRLEDVTIYVTKEPCAMCAGAMVNARVKRLVYGMPDPRSGCAGSALDVTGFDGMLHQVEVSGGILEWECKELIQNFFRKVRIRKKPGNKAVGNELQ